MRKKGWKRKETITWVKFDRFGNQLARGGYHWMHSNEQCLVFMRKNPINKSNRFQVLRANCNTIITQVAGTKISQKPFQLYEHIEAAVNGGPLLELFARKHNQREGWLSIGDEAIEYKRDRAKEQPKSAAPGHENNGNKGQIPEQHLAKFLNEAASFV